MFDEMLIICDGNPEQTGLLSKSANSEQARFSRLDLLQRVSFYHKTMREVRPHLSKCEGLM